MRTLDWTSLSTEERRVALERPAQRGAQRIAREARTSSRRFAAAAMPRSAS